MLFYADDRMISGENTQHVQTVCDWEMELFRRMGIKMNPNKTKALVSDTGGHPHKTSDKAYTKRISMDRIPCMKCGIPTRGCS